MRRAFEPTRLGTIELFCKAAELERFSAAAEALGVTPAAVSRAVGRLEARLGVRLFARTTRQVRLTDDGRLYFEQCREALARIHEAERAITGHQAEPAGVLRVSMPTTYAHHRVLPLLPEFARRFPQVRLDVSVSNRNVDFVDEGFDVAIRLGVPQDSRLIARTLEDAALVVVAAPSYLERAGMPASMDELSAHRCIQFILPSTGRPMPWLLRDQGRSIEFAFDSDARFSEDVLACVSYARAGGGLFQTYRFIVSDDIARGDLVEVLPRLGGATRPFSILYPAHRHMSARLRVFVDFLSSRVGRSQR